MASRRRWAESRRGKWPLEPHLVGLSVAVRPLAQVAVRRRRYHEKPSKQNSVTHPPHPLSAPAPTVAHVVVVVRW